MISVESSPSFYETEKYWKGIQNNIHCNGGDGLTFARNSLIVVKRCIENNININDLTKEKVSPLIERCISNLSEQELSEALRAVDELSTILVPGSY